MKLLFTGTDSLHLIDLSKRKWSKKPYWWAFRLFVRIADRFFIQSIVCSGHLTVENVMRFGVKSGVELWETPIKQQKVLPKKSHKGFNILYYFPKGGDVQFNKWLYGYDLFEYLKNRLNVDWVAVDGSNDMRKIYPVIDFMIRPNRHDGNARMVRECKIQGIPYYWSDQNPNVNEMLEMIIKVIKNVQS